MCCLALLLNRKATIELLVEKADEIGFSRFTILNLHALLADNLVGNPQAGGRLRRIPISVRGGVYHPIGVPQLIEECFERWKPRLPAAGRTPDVTATWR